jgi:hypothetical protein
MSDHLTRHARLAQRGHVAEVSRQPGIVNQSGDPSGWVTPFLLGMATDCVAREPPSQRATAALAYSMTVVPSARVRNWPIEKP